jgi:hypothetical protein
MVLLVVRPMLTLGIGAMATQRTNPSYLILRVPGTDYDNSCYARLKREAEAMRPEDLQYADSPLVEAGTADIKDRCYGDAAYKTSYLIL